MELYSGTCGSLTSLDCNDDIDGADNRFSSISVDGRTPGEVLLARVWGYDGSSGGFNISAYDASLGTPVFNEGQFSYYPNPVKNSLTLAHERTISDVAVFNLIGQQVITRKANANVSEIDTSSLPSGAYIVKITVDNQMKTIKVIKE
jgi:hypothetical protein